MPARNCGLPPATDAKYESTAGGAVVADAFPRSTIPRRASCRHDARRGIVDLGKASATTAPPAVDSYFASVAGGRPQFLAGIARVPADFSARVRQSGGSGRSGWCFA